MNIERVSQEYAPRSVALLEDLHVSLLGISSRRLLTVVVDDGIRAAIDCRIACDQGEAKGIVIAAPASYWRSLPAKHWGIAAASVRARLAGHPAASSSVVPSETLALLQTGSPPRTWSDPGDAWRIIFVGTAADARGKGIAAQLYQSVMADRSLVARVALDNTASIRLHHSLGWRLYRDGGVALAVHSRDDG
jgi:GNAT superfamily N-acetyltransferase